MIEPAEAFSATAERTTGAGPPTSCRRRRPTQRGARSTAVPTEVSPEQRPEQSQPTDARGRAQGAGRRAAEKAAPRGYAPLDAASMSAECGSRQANSSGEAATYTVALYDADTASVEDELWEPVLCRSQWLNLSGPPALPLLDPPARPPARRPTLSMGLSPRRALASRSHSLRGRTSRQIAPPARSHLPRDRTCSEPAAHRGI